MASTVTTAGRKSATPRIRPSRAAAPLALLCLSACGYGFSSRANSHIESIAIPIFENKTLERGIEQEVADGIADAFLADKKLRVVDVKDADSVLLGTIERYERTPYSFDAQQNVREYKVELTLHVTYEDRKRNKIVWEETAMRPWGTYSVSASLPNGIEEERTARDRAVEKAAQDILIKTVQGW
jgi:hypothetical protein